MVTLDTNETHGLALVVDSNWRTDTPRYIALKDAPPLAPDTDPQLKYTFLNQLHYIAGHGIAGVSIVDFNTPRDGWKRWHP